MWSGKCSRLVLATICLLYFVINLARAQAKIDIDSVKQVAENSNDSLRIIAYRFLCEIFRDSNQVKSLEYARTLNQFGQHKENPRAICLSLMSFGEVFTYIGDYERSIEFYDSAYQVVRHYRFEKERAMLNNQLGKAYALRGNHDKAIDHFLLANDYFKSVADTPRVARVLSNIGNVYSDMQKYSQALEYYERSLSLKNRNKEPVSYGITLNNIALVLIEQKKFDQAIEILFKCISIYSVYQSENDLALTLANLGKVYAEKRLFDKSYENLKDALSLFTKLNDNRGIVMSYELLGRCALLENNYVKAEEYLKNALNISQASSMLVQLESIYDLLFTIKSRQEEYKQALFYLTKKNAIKDTLFNKDKLEHIRSLVNKFEIREHLREIEGLRKSNEISNLKMRQRETMFSLMAATLLIGMLITFFFIYRSRTTRNIHFVKLENLVKDQKIKMAEAKRQAMEFKLIALRSQMDPHFIFNALNSIQSLIVSENSFSAYGYLSKFSKLLRRVLENSENPSVPINVELEMLVLYLDIEKLRFNSDFEYKIEVDENVDQDSVVVPCMLLQPIVENCLKHGLLNKRGYKLIKVAISVSNGIVRCIIEDNGIGRKAANEQKKYTVDEKKSKGLKLVEDRLFAIDSAAKLEIVDLYDHVNSPAGTRVTIQLTIDHALEKKDNLLLNNSRLLLET